MYEFASSSATLLPVYTAVMHTRRMNVIPEADRGTMIVYITINEYYFGFGQIKLSYVMPTGQKITEMNKKHS